MEFHAWEPWMVSPSFVSRSASAWPRLLPSSALATGPSLLEPHPVGVTVVAVALVLVTVARGHAGLAHDDHARRAPVDAEAAAGADVLVDHEDDVVVRVDARLHGVGGIGDGLGGEHVDALPRADVDAALAHDALGLVDVEELLRLDRPAEVVRRDLLEDVVAGEARHRRVGVGLRHQAFLTRGRP